MRQICLSTEHIKQQGFDSQCLSAGDHRALHRCNDLLSRPLLALPHSDFQTNHVNAAIAHNEARPSYFDSRTCYARTQTSNVLWFMYIELARPLCGGGRKDHCRYEWTLHFFRCIVSSHSAAPGRRSLLSLREAVWISAHSCVNYC